MGAEVSMLPEAPEASSSGTRDSRPRAAAEGATQSAAPEAEAPEASAGHREAESYSCPQHGIPEVASSGASPVALRAGRHVQRLGRFRVDFATLRKRKGSPSCSGDAFWPLKQRKYIAIDE